MIAMLAILTVIRGYAPVSGLQMYYEIHGSGGTPLVLLHGGGSTIETSFAKLLPLLSRQAIVPAPVPLVKLPLLLHQFRQLLKNYAYRNSPPT